MTQVTELRTGKWAHQIATNDEVVEKVKEIKDLIRKNSWGTKYIFVYGRRENVLEFIDSTNWDKYERMTFMSKQVTLSQLNGLIRIYINEWIGQKEEPKVAVRFLTGNKKGQIKEISAAWVNEYVEAGIAEVV